MSNFLTKVKKFYKKVNLKLTLSCRPASLTSFGEVEILAVNRQISGFFEILAVRLRQKMLCMRFTHICYTFFGRSCARNDRNDTESLISCIRWWVPKIWKNQVFYTWKSVKLDESPGFAKFRLKIWVKIWAIADSYQKRRAFRLSQTVFSSENWLIFAKFLAFLAKIAYRFQICRILNFKFKFLEPVGWCRTLSSKMSQFSGVWSIKVYICRSEAVLCWLCADPGDSPEKRTFIINKKEEEPFSFS